MGKAWVLPSRSRESTSFAGTPRSENDVGAEVAFFARLPVLLVVVLLLLPPRVRVLRGLARVCDVVMGWPFDVPEGVPVP